MDYYIDIVVLPDTEVSASVLMNNLFAKFHRALVRYSKDDIAVSFPKYGKSLGNALRIHGCYTTLEHLMAQPWLKGLRDYTRGNIIKPVPNHIIGYRTVYRVQKKSPHNLRKRAITKGRMTEQEALTKIPDSLQERLSFPFIQIQSLSSQQIMRIYVAQGNIQPEPIIGKFSSYGMSRTSTVPYF